MIEPELDDLKYLILTDVFKLSPNEPPSKLLKNQKVLDTRFKPLLEQLCKPHPNPRELSTALQRLRRQIEDHPQNEYEELFMIKYQEYENNTHYQQRPS